MSDDFPGDDLLNPELMALLERLTLANREMNQDRSGTAGPARVDELGVDFYEYSAYQPGLDIRHVDWSVYGRTGSLLVRAYESHREQPICILLDASASMALGNPPKFELARRLAACIAYIGLVSYHPVRIIAFGGGRLKVLPHRMGRAAVHDVLRFIGDCRPGGETKLAAGAEAAMAGVSRRAGRLFFLTDFLDPAGLGPVFALLGGTRRVVDLILVRDEAEGELPLGAAEGVDPETGATLPLQITPELAADYRGALKGARAELARRANDIQAVLTEFPSTTPLEDALTRLLG